MKKLRTLRTKEIVLISMVSAIVAVIFGSMIISPDLSFAKKIWIWDCLGEGIEFRVSWWWNPVLVFFYVGIIFKLWNRRVEEYEGGSFFKKLLYDPETEAFGGSLLAFFIAPSILAGPGGALISIGICGIVVAFERENWWTNAVATLILSIVASILFNPILGVAITASNGTGYVIGSALKLLYIKKIKTIWENIP